MSISYVDPSIGGLESNEPRVDNKPSPKTVLLVLLLVSSRLSAEVNNETDARRALVSS